MDRSSILLMAISTIAACFLVIGHRTGWIFSALADFSLTRRGRDARPPDKQPARRPRPRHFGERLRHYLCRQLR
ncbi:MAG TPA: hypothetical protein VKZ96_08795 [Thermomicrobiales bacterium]|nr:hypothetical protein [Thermomicrobiales bacterium]